MKKASILAAALLLTACDGNGQPIDMKHFFSGKQAEDKKEPVGMLEAAKEAEKRGDIAQSIALYKVMLNKFDDKSAAMMALADSYRRTADPDLGILLYDELLKQDPTLSAAKEGKGLALMGKGDFNGSPPLFSEVMKESPTRWKTLNALGILFTTRNMQPEAQQYFHEALKYNPISPAINNNLGLSQALQHNYDAAIQSLQTASNLAPTGMRERNRIDLNLAMVYAIAGKPDEANKVARAYLSGPQLEAQMALYSQLASQESLATTSIYGALTDKQVFLEEAWDTMQDITDANHSSNITPVFKDTAVR